MGDEMAPCCQGCQDGCGGYKSHTARSMCGTPGCANTNQEEPDFIDPECLDEGHTRVVRGDTMGVCDSNGFTDYDGQPCSRDCEDRCPDPARALESCDLNPPADGIPLEEFCDNDCIQGATVYPLRRFATAR